MITICVETSTVAEKLERCKAKAYGALQQYCTDYTNNRAKIYEWGGMEIMGTIVGGPSDQGAGVGKLRCRSIVWHIGENGRERVCQPATTS